MENPGQFWVEINTQYLALAVLVTPELLLIALGYDVASPRLWWLAGVGLSAYGVAGRLIYQGLTR